MGTASPILDANRGLCGSGLYRGNFYDPWHVSNFLLAKLLRGFEYGNGITGISLIWRIRCCSVAVWELLRYLYSNCG